MDPEQFEESEPPSTGSWRPIPSMPPTSGLPWGIGQPPRYEDRGHSQTPWSMKFVRKPEDEDQVERTARLREFLQTADDLNSIQWMMGQSEVRNVEICVNSKRLERLSVDDGVSCWNICVARLKSSWLCRYLRTERPLLS